MLEGFRYSCKVQYVRRSEDFLWVCRSMIFGSASLAILGYVFSGIALRFEDSFFPLPGSGSRLRICARGYTVWGLSLRNVVLKV